MTSPRTTPARLNLKKDEKLEITWQDGVTSILPITLLRAQCPCASCKQFREEQTSKPKTSLTILTGTHTGPIVAVRAEMVGNYALRIDWSDDHNTGIYSFDYLRELSKQ